MKFPDEPLNIEHLNLLLSEGEGYSLEFKESVSSSLSRELTALANSSGGMVLIGVNDSGAIIGHNLSNRERSRIQDIAGTCQPAVVIDMESIGKVTLVHVRESDAKPVQCSDGFFLRQGANSQKLTRDQIIDFIHHEGRVRWDEQTYRGHTADQIFSPRLLKAYLKKSGISTSLPDRDILANLGIIINDNGTDHLTHAGFLFFAELPELARSYWDLTCALYKGTDKVHILDRKDFGDDLLSNIENAITFVLRNTNVRYEFNGSPQRKEIYEIPPKAIRESIINAVLHRDYV